jgi:DNA-binding CsgD family transcriptional regulator
MGTDHATDAVRIANGRMLLATRHGTGIDAKLLSAVHRLPKVDDPLVRSSFRHVWSCVLTMTARYREALEASEEQLEEAEQYRLAFVLPLAYIRRALALRGLRRFREALECLNQAQLDRDIDDDHIGISASSARIGTYVAMGNFDEALKVPEPSSPTSAAANVVAELKATMALAYACANRPEDARATAQRAHALSTAAEPRLIAKLAEVVTALQQSAENSGELVHDVFHDVVRSANADAFVTAYRGFPRLLLEASRAPESHARLVSIVSAAGDLKIAKAILPGDTSLRLPEYSLLTAREKDILALVSQGFRNREIAQQLFISEMTVKTHVGNILKKLGARSRTHAVSIANRES